MSWIDGLKHRLRTVFRSSEHTRDLDDEIRLHMELDAANERDEAGSARRFGNRTYYKEEVRQRTWLGFLDVARQDLSYAWRTTRRSPGFTAVVVLTLGLGIGANASVFSLLDRIYLRPPSGVTDPWALRRTWVEHFRVANGPPYKSTSISYVLYDAIATATGTREESALYTTDFAVRLGKRPSDPRVGVVYATANYFDVLGVRPAFGRFYLPDEDRMGNGARVVVVSHAFWKNTLHGDSAALGKTIPLGKDLYTVIGVADPSFTGLDLRRSDVWVPLASNPVAGRYATTWWTDDALMWFNVIRRLTPAMPDAEFERRASAVVHELNVRKGVLGDTLSRAWTGPILEARGPATLGPDVLISTRLGGVAVMVLLIAAANVINLLLARATNRRREIAVRLALGISRWRLVRMLTTETLMLAALAGVAGLVASWWGASLLRGLIMPETPWTDPPVGGRVIAFAAGVSLLAGLIAGIVPAIQASNPGLTSALKAGARSGARHGSLLRGSLVITQTALTVTLLVGAALFVRSLRNVESLDIGYDANRLFFSNIEFVEGETPPLPVIAETVRGIAARLRDLPGVENVARAGWAPMQAIGFAEFSVGADSTASFGRRAPNLSSVSPSFFRTVGLRMLRGRTFTGEDVAQGPAEVVVNEATAKLIWPGRDPLGACVQFKKRPDTCFTVVGVVETGRLISVIEEEPVAQFYVPLGSLPKTASGASIIMRTRPGDPTRATSELMGALRQAFPSAAPSVVAMTTNLEPEYRPWRTGASLFTVLGLLAMVVAMIGIYGTMSYGVTQRTHEFGVRVALGARVGQVVRQVIVEGLRTVATGVALGIVLALAMGRLVTALLYGVAPRDPAVLATVAASLMAVAVLAALVPAWKAARADPITALRAD